MATPDDTLTVLLFAVGPVDAPGTVVLAMIVDGVFGVHEAVMVPIPLTYALPTTFGGIAQLMPGPAAAASTVPLTTRFGVG